MKMCFLDRLILKEPLKIHPKISVGSIIVNPNTSRLLFKNILKQINKQMLERMRRKGNPSALLVGMQTGEATVENSMEFPQKSINGTAL